MLPTRKIGKWRVRLSDLDTGNILYQTENQGAFINSTKRFYVRFIIEISDIDADGIETSVLSHRYDAKDRHILVQIPVGTLGDTIGWFSYVARFAERHHCRLTVAMSGLIIPLFRDEYQHISLVTHAEVIDGKLVEEVYATYSIGLFFEDAEFIWQPTDFRHVGLHRTAGYILGVNPAEEPPRISIPDASRPISERYAVIAVQSTSGCKMWNNPDGWRLVVANLRARGYRVVCIDQRAVNGHGLMWMHIPHGAEDQTGDRPLTERARWLKHADMFVGLSSGLAWLAWAVGTPVVMISGFSHPTNEFDTPYRVVNWHVCNSCWNDPRERFDHRDFMWCPRHAGTDRHFECTRLITCEAVLQAIDRIPGCLERRTNVGDEVAHRPPY